MHFLGFFLIGVLLSAPLFSQESSVTGDSFWSEGSTPKPSDQKDFQFQNKPRLEDKFGPVGYGFFRFFAITVGTVPLSYLVGSQIYDWSVYAARGGELRWRPGLLGWENNKAGLSTDERTKRTWEVAGVTIGISLVVAVIDTILYHLLYSPSAKAKKGKT